MFKFGLMYSEIAQPGKAISLPHYHMKAVGLRDQLCDILGSTAPQWRQTSRAAFMGRIFSTSRRSRA